MKTLKVKFAFFTLLAMLAVSVFLTSCEQSYITTTEDSNLVENYIALLGDEDASIEEVHELYLSLNSQELVEANNIIIEKTIEQARQENDEIALNFFTQNQNTFSEFYNAIENQATKVYGVSSNQLDSENLDDLYEDEINKLDFIPFEEIQDEEIAIESRYCPAYHFPVGICQGGSMVASSNYSFDGKDYYQWDCGWVFSFLHNHYTKVNSNNWYVKSKLSGLGNCKMRARHLTAPWGKKTELLLPEFFPFGRTWVQSKLKMGF